MKEEDLNNIALKILRNDGSNKWQKLVNVCDSLNVTICPIVISSNKQYIFRFYLNNFYFPDDGIGATKLDSKCNAVDKFLNRYVNISKVSSCNKYIENNRDIVVNMVPNDQITQNVANQINQSDERTVLVKLANICISKYTGDLWSLLNKYSASEKIRFYPKFIRRFAEHSCSFVFNNIEFEDKIVVASTRIDAARMLAEKFIRAYTSDFKDFEKKMDHFFIFLARECQLSRQKESSKTFSSICEYLNIDHDMLITKSGDKYICTLILNHKQYPIAGEGSNENEAFIAAIEIFFDKCFSPEILREIQKLKVLNEIVNYATANKFSDDWKSICNSCKLLGYKCHERFTERNGTYSVEFFIDNVSCGLIGTGLTRNAAGISLGKQFMEKFKNLKDIYIEKINQFDEEKFFLFVATLCVNKFWSNNWSVLTNICSKYKINLLRCVKNEVNNQIRCSIFIGIYSYEKFVNLSNYDLAFNIVTQHFFTKYGKRNLPENDMKELMKEITELMEGDANKSKEQIYEKKAECQVLNMNAPITYNNEILLNGEKLFKIIAAYCISHPKSDDWKTLCNACKCLKQSIYEIFTFSKSNFFCEVYINNENINIKEKSSTRKRAAITVARKFINKYICKNSEKPKPSSVKALENCSINDKTNSEQIFKNVANYFKSFNSNCWDSFCNTCKLLNYEMEESCESDGKRFVSQVSIENISLDFTGKDSTRRGAKLSFVKQFLDRYCTSDTYSEKESQIVTGSPVDNDFSKLQISEENSSNQSDDKMEYSKLHVSEEDSSNQSDEKMEYSKLQISEEDSSNQSDEIIDSKLNTSEENSRKQSDDKMTFSQNESQKIDTRLFVDKEFSKLNISKENISNKSDEKMEYSKLNPSKVNSSNQSEEKMDYSKLNLFEKNSSSQSDDDDTSSSVTSESENMFKEIANLCMLNPVKNEWKTFCNACLSLKYKMIHRFVYHDDGQYECVVYLNKNQIKCGVKCSTHLNAGICTAKYFIQKYATIHDTLDEALYERIASLCQSTSYKDDWKTLCNTCKLYRFKYREQIYKKQNEYFCEIFIKDKLLDLVGQGKTELKAAIDLAQQFMEKYYKPKTSESNQNLPHCTFQDESKYSSINVLEKPLTIPKASDLNQYIPNSIFQEEPKIFSVNPIEKSVTIPITSDVNQNLAHSTYQEDSKYGSINPIEKPCPIPKKENYEGVYFLTY